MARMSPIDERYMGDEPTISSKSTCSDIIHAYNWYNYFYDVDAAKGFVLSYLKSKKANKAIIDRVSQIDAFNLANIGWNCRILMNGGTLPDEVKESFTNKLQTLINKTQPEKKVVIEEVKTGISIQEKIANKTNELIGDLECQIDLFIENGKNDFDVKAWFRDNAIKAPIAKKIVDYYKPLYDEVYDAHQGKDDQLNEYYHNWKKSELKKYMEFIKSIISAASVNVEIAKVTRKPRKKKVKPASQMVNKVSYKQEDKEYNVKSIDPKDIIGSQQLWTFNTKYRTLSVFNAMSATGLSVKGTTIRGFDEKTSLTKKLRKPDQYISSVTSGGKITLRKLMESIKGKDKTAKGRLNSDTVILRAIK